MRHCVPGALVSCPCPSAASCSVGSGVFGSEVDSVGRSVTGGETAIKVVVLSIESMEQSMYADTVNASPTMSVI